MINTKSRMSGRFSMFTLKSDTFGNPIEGSRKKRAEFDNLILNQGLNEIGARSISSSILYVHVGSGSSVPVSTQTGLDSPIANTPSVESLQESAQSSVAPYYVSYNVVKRFSQGAAAGNISEVGVGWASNNTSLFSRALILDSSNSPTSITVLPDEILEVTYELRIYPQDSDQTGTIELDGITFDYTARACNADTLTSGNGSAPGWWFQHSGNERPVFPQSTGVYDGSIGATILDVPSGNRLPLQSQAAENAYSSGSYQASNTCTFGLADGNLVSGIRSFATSVGWSAWQIEFSAQGSSDPVFKTDTQTLTITTTHSWARS